MSATFGQTSEKIISECEEIYPEFETLGKQKFQQRYLHHSSLRVCPTLYNDMAWFSAEPNRTDRLMALLDTPKITSYVRDRFEQNYIIPQWIKDDATRWHQGKERDNIFSYGIRYMINSQMIQAPKSIDQARCTDQICVVKNNYLKYSIKNNQNDDIILLKHTFGSSGNVIAINSVETSKDGKKTDSFHINGSGFNEIEKKHYEFVHPIPILLDTKIDSVYEINTTSKIVFSFRNQQRDAFVAWDSTKQYQEIIDKQTGVVLYAKHYDRIKKTGWHAELMETNMFSKEVTIQYVGMNIPDWFKNTVKWWTEGKISDPEYLANLNYLIKSGVIHI